MKLCGCPGGFSPASPRQANAAPIPRHAGTVGFLVKHNDPIGKASVRTHAAGEKLMNLGEQSSLLLDGNECGQHEAPDREFLIQANGWRVEHQMRSPGPHGWKLRHAPREYICALTGDRHLKILMHHKPQS